GAARRITRRSDPERRLPRLLASRTGRAGGAGTTRAAHRPTAAQNHEAGRPRAAGSTDRRVATSVTDRRRRWLSRSAWSPRTHAGRTWWSRRARRPPTTSAAL